ncbi:MAG: hypothetical protein PHH08_00425 [Candidatus ainarchaeum sp.]|nr:hypothetical protein [Candidatus ainarchaeum sp.]
MNKTAQGAIEYLLLVGGAVIVAAVLLVLLTGAGTNIGQSVENSLSETACKLNPENCGKKIVSFWGVYVGGVSYKPGEWQAYMELFPKLKEIGFTHFGVNVWDSDPDFAGLIADVRAIGPIMLHYGPGFPHQDGNPNLLDPNSIEGQNHPENGQDMKYFGAAGFDAYKCSSYYGMDWCEKNNGLNCSLKPNQLAIDPSYTGRVWQAELDSFQKVLDKVPLQENDIVEFDLEIWMRPSYVDGDIINDCYRGALSNNTVNYSGTLQEKYVQYYNYWKARGADLAAEAKASNGNAGIIFYHENIPPFSNPNDIQKFDTYTPAGSGDAASPSFYFLPDLARLQNKLDAGDYSGSYPWISFSRKSGTDFEK